MPATPFAIDARLLYHSFPEAYVARGAKYYDEGRVLSANFNPAQGMVSGRVRGSGRKTYQCIVRLADEADGSLGIAGQCSCPVGYNCKHVVAVLLSLGDNPVGSFRSPPDRELPPGVLSWLRRLEALAAAESAEDPHRLLYLVDRDERAGVTQTVVRTVRVRLLAAGGYGKPQDFNISGDSRASFVTPEDRRIMLLMEAGRGRMALPTLALGREIGADVLRAIAATGRGHWQTPASAPLRLAPPLGARLAWRLGEDGQLRVKLEAERADLDLLPLTPPWYLDPASGECGPLETGLGDGEAGLLSMAPAVGPDAAEVIDDLARTRLKGLAVPLPPPPERRRVEVERPVPRLLLRSEDLTAGLPAWHRQGEEGPVWAHSAILRFAYGTALLDPRDPARVVKRVADGVLLESGRDREAELAALGELVGLGFEEADATEEIEGLWLALPGAGDWVWFMRHDAPRLQARGWRIELEEGFRFRIAATGDWRLRVEEDAGGGWLGVGLGVEVEGEPEPVDLLPLLVELIQRYRQELSPERLAQLDGDQELSLHLPDGRLIMLPVERLRPILSTLVELYDHESPLSGGGRLRLPRLQAAQLAELEESTRLHWDGGEEAREWGRRLRDFRGVEEVAPPAALDAELRAYQRQGLDWLQFLRQYELGGVLADDMGLGKTVQALAHILTEKEAGRADRPSLVVAPTSLMFNWRREAERFAPSLKVLLLHGPERRSRFREITGQDLVLTTYPLLARDLDALSRHSYHLVILDEAQAIKNPRSKAAQAARALEARHRLCLTGTPLENHLGELWALVDFLMPDALGDERRFRRLFRNPIERTGDEDRQEQLRRRVAPLLLRRTKESVAAELPPKTEMLRETALANDQRDLYETLRLSLHQRVRQEIDRKGMARSGIIILDALLKLRQVCCDPRLVSLPSARKVKGSAKLDLLMELLPELLEEGRRVLLFSQFTSMLALIEEALTTGGRAAGRDFVKLTGRTRNRAEPVDRFQSGEVPLFLISLKAGGSGLNLTAADTVIHYDPWWNPAVERQATDRAHRIGQDKPVFVYKLLTEGTVEQRVAELQARKQALADAMLAGGGGAAAGSLSAEDLELLFAPVADR